MRVLIISTPVSSHLSPMVPLAWALRAAGHDVLVIGQPDVMGMAASAGLNAVRVGERFQVEEVLKENLKDGERLVESHTEPEPEVMDNYFDLWFGHQRTMLPQYLDFARAFRPHLLVCDLLEYSAPVIGALLGVPVVRHRWSVDFLTGFVRPQARTALHDTCRELGLDALPDPTLVLDPCPPTLQLPDAEPGTPIRAVPFNGNGQLPEWRRQEWGPSGRYAGWPCPWACARSSSTGCRTSAASCGPSRDWRTPRRSPPSSRSSTRPSDRCRPTCG